MAQLRKDSEELQAQRKAEGGLARQEKERLEELVRKAQVSSNLMSKFIPDSISLFFFLYRVNPCGRVSNLFFSYIVSVCYKCF